MAENTIKHNPDIAYHSVSSDMDLTDSASNSNRPKIELGNHPQLSQKRGIIVTFIVQIFALLWLVPIVALLWLNFSGYIIGATAWCPGRHCWVEMFNPVTTVPQQRLVDFDKRDHNLLGGLQLVAKALEVWFVFISAALVYIVTMHFAAKHEGLPIGYLTRPIEFADPVTLVDPLLYRTGPHPWGNKSQGDKILGRRVWFLIILSVSLCILCNLMGPATAVLVIPSLQWISTPKIGDQHFTGLNSAEPPRTGNTSWFWQNTYCYEEHIQNSLYTCTYYPFGVTLDQWAANAVSNRPFTSQRTLNFQGNVTAQITGDNKDAVAKDMLFWAPSRQVVDNLAIDGGVVDLISEGYSLQTVNATLEANIWNSDQVSTYVEYNKSRELQITRNGPIAGAIVNMWYNFNDSTNLFTVDVAADRKIRCYKEYDLWYTPLAQGSSQGTYTKCMQVGSGWGENNKQAYFEVMGQYDPDDRQKVTPGVDVTIFSSEKVAFFPNGDLPSWLPAVCLSNSKQLNSTNCDWDRLFNVDPESPVANRSINMNTIEYVMFDGQVSANFVADFNAVLAFTNYSLDPSPFTNPASFVKNADLPNWGKSAHVDPAWVLAAWAADLNGFLHANRTMTNLLLEQMQMLFKNQTSAPLADATSNLNYVALLPVWQTLSFIDYSTDLDSAVKQVADEDHPLLERYARMNVWAYKMGSRTSYMGAAVGILGCLVVVAQVVLGFVDRRRYRSPTQLLVAALEHAPRGEFEGRDHDERAMAGVRFHIQDDGNHTGKFSFYEPVGHPRNRADSGEKNHVVQ